MARTQIPDRRLLAEQIIVHIAKIRLVLRRQFLPDAPIQLVHKIDEGFLRIRAIFKPCLINILRGIFPFVFLKDRGKIFGFRAEMSKEILHI